MNLQFAYNGPWKFHHRGRVVSEILRQRATANDARDFEVSNTKIIKMKV